MKNRDYVMVPRDEYVEAVRKGAFLDVLIATVKREKFRAEDILKYIIEEKESQEKKIREIMDSIHSVMDRVVNSEEGEE